MGPIEVLADEHRVILHAAALLERRLDALDDGGQALDRQWFHDMLDFLRTFADRRHHGKEEQLLFPLMAEQLDYPREAGPIAVLTADHGTARALVRAMAEALGVPDSHSAAACLVKDGRNYVRLLRAHIDREDDKVFPTVEDMLDADDALRSEAAFTQFEATLPPMDPSSLLTKLGRK